MKKIALLVFALILSASALAEIDLTGMTYDELVALKDQINLAIWNSEEWQEVTVPAGLYHIGNDIPAGRWTIRPSDGNTAELYYGTGLTDGGASIDDVYDAEQITSPSDSYAKYNDIESMTWTLEDGAYIKIESSSVVFTPYSGNSFSFR